MPMREGQWREPTGEESREGIPAWVAPPLVEERFRWELHSSPPRAEGVAYAWQYLEIENSRFGFCTLSAKDMQREKREDEGEELTEKEVVCAATQTTIAEIARNGGKREWGIVENFRHHTQGSDCSHNGRAGVELKSAARRLRRDIVRGERHQLRLEVEYGRPRRATGNRAERGRRGNLILPLMTGKAGDV